MAWNSRFKQKSAALKRKQLDLPARVADEDVRAAREIDPAPYLNSHGFKVKKDGQFHWSVRAGKEEIYRLTRTKDGAWLFCDKHRSEGGDNIQLVQHLEPGKSFQEAVYTLIGSPLPTSSMPAVAPKQIEVIEDDERVPPRLPLQRHEDLIKGRVYLEDRGIDLETIRDAEDAGVIRYASGSVFFVGYDENKNVQAVTKRAIQPGPDDLKRRDLSGSLKEYCQILPGNTREVWIAEGGVSGLAIQAMAKRLGKTIPTVIISGGAGVMKFLDREYIHGILKSADRVIISAENEKNLEVQEDTDLAHKKQQSAIEEITGKQVFIVKPDDSSIGDTADLNLHSTEDRTCKPKFKDIDSNSEFAW